MNVKAWIQRRPVVTYFGVAYSLSLLAFLVIYGLPLVRGTPVQPTTALLMFPIMVIGVGLTGIALTSVLDGAAGRHALFARMRHWHVGIGWYAAAILLPPVLILVVLFSFQALVSANFAPKVFPFGILFGVLAGFFEEIGWTGFAFPRMSANRGALSAAVLLGVLWGLWHLPVVDSLGAASPHGASWLAFAIAFIALVTAIRVLISWIFTNTGSLLLAQVLHASSTGFLVVLSPVRVSPAQEALWYAVYAGVLWIVVGVVVAIYGASLSSASTRLGRDVIPSRSEESLGQGL